ncbi:MAG TPA: carboxylating nicotinate-nucleotide diphosphorylase [Candidatus Thermoplasmatota archaeon]|nr:carboxylating nicotinate-nucleotide diphosphorylase [Candidatus Thermoplasmatota archaeon]
MADALRRFLDEDLGQGDLTSQAVVRGESAKAVVFPREACVLAGGEEAAAVFAHLGLKVARPVADGDRVPPRATVLAIEGDAAAILSGERVALNLLMRLSGIATATRLVVERCRTTNPKIEVAATRKTTPGLRELEKKAVVLGGGHPHRMRLDDAILVKENHIEVAGSVEEAVRRVRERFPDRPFQVEARSREEALAAVSAGARALLLDNFDPTALAAVAKEIRARHPDVFLEASGGVDPDEAQRYARHVDRVSLGRLTHSVTAIDFALDLADVRRAPRP